MTDKERFVLLVQTAYLQQVLTSAIICYSEKTKVTERMEPIYPDQLKIVEYATHVDVSKIPTRPDAPLDWFAGCFVSTLLHQPGKIPKWVKWEKKTQEEKS